MAKVKERKPTSLAFQVASCFLEMRAYGSPGKKTGGFLEKARLNWNKTKRFPVKSLGKDAGEGVKKQRGPVEFRPGEEFFIFGTNMAIGFGAGQQQRSNGKNDEFDLNNLGIDYEVIKRLKGSKRRTTQGLGEG
ncbi:hypothetical protein K435DRAFT_874520 [Dendrothele bispora CBS 962.96]|uniref:Uncharacterized protein n=1 Tax=Dendrothele bispora (strain CBS 962.96) TaxID=1314807 RepID=A0A4S8KWV1_DENBC|nr:hypothetical protein K435DRAFT_874520 [Dendrothele bispora CBS 962.96]